jgi:hypothetical protein
MSMGEVTLIAAILAGYLAGLSMLAWRIRAGYEACRFATPLEPAGVQVPLRQMGGRQVGYGVQPHHYGLVCRALVRTRARRRREG